MRYFFAIILPPLAVLSCGKIFATLFNIFLCILGWIPAIIHALFVVKSYNDKQNAIRIESAILKASRQAHQDSLELPARMSAEAVRMRVEQTKAQQHQIPEPKR